MYRSVSAPITASQNFSFVEEYYNSHGRYPATLLLSTFFSCELLNLIWSYVIGDTLEMFVHYLCTQEST